MFSRELSFAPDRRSVNDSFYRFSSGPGRYGDRQGLFGQDPRYNTFEKEYKEKYNFDDSYRRKLIDILLTRIPTGQHNTSFLAAANLGVYSMKRNGLAWTPDNLQNIFNDLSTVLLPNMTDKTPEEANLIVAKHRTTLYRYMNYIREHTSDLEFLPSEVEVEIVEETLPESSPVSSPETMVVRRSLPRSQVAPSVPSVPSVPPVPSVPSVPSVSPVPPEEITVTLAETLAEIEPELAPPSEDILTPFDQIQAIILTGTLEKYELSPEYQHLSTPPNQIMVFTDFEGRSYLAEVQYDPEAGQIFPPQR